MNQCLSKTNGNLPISSPKKNVVILHQSSPNINFEQVSKPYMETEWSIKFGARDLPVVDMVEFFLDLLNLNMVEFPVTKT